MDDIHTPTIPSGPASTHTSGSENHPGATSLQDLIAEKTRTEEELKALSGVLDSVCNLEILLAYNLANRCCPAIAWGQHEHELDYF